MNGKSIILLCALISCLDSVGAGAQDFRRRERFFDVQHYKIEVRFDQPNRMVLGQVTITLSPLRPVLDSIVLDAVNMTIEDVRLPKGAPLRFVYDSSTLRVRLDRPYRYGEKLDLAVRYRCVPERGLYFIQPDASYPNAPEQIWTQGQGEDNRYWLPCFDYPNDKATSEVFMTVKSDYETLSNGALQSSRKHPDGTTTWHWVQDKPHSSYLIMIGAGRYKIHRRVWDGIPVLSYYYPGDSAADVERSYGTTASMVRFFSEYTGIRYPWAKYAQIPVARFPYGGMENTTATVLADYRTVVDARAGVDYSAEALIAHELAHQWWGDCLTYIDWENGWLNEGFATYFQQLWTEHASGADDFAYLRREGIQGYLDWVDQSGRIPVVTDRPNASYNIYGKGAAVLHMLRRLVGDEQFRRIIHAYGASHMYGSVETNDFKRTVEGVTGLSMRWFFDQWLYKAGYPELQVRHTWDAAAGILSVRLGQRQKTDSLCGDFRLPILLRAVVGDSTMDKLVWLNRRDTSIAWSMPTRPSYVMVDPDGTICGRITHEQSTAELLAQFRSAASVSIRIDAGLALVGRLDDVGARDGFFDALLAEPHSGVRFKVATALSRLKPDSIRYRDALKQTMLTLLHDPKANVRATALNCLNAFRDRSLRAAFDSALKDSSYFVEAAAMNCVLTIDSTDTEDLVLRTLVAPSYRDVVAQAALDWVTRYRITKALPVVRRLAMPGPLRELRMKSINTLFEMGEPLDSLRHLVDGLLREPAWEFRMFGASLLRAVYPADAEMRLRALVNKESDSRVRKHIEALLAERAGKRR
jgi:aminopeptidase N